VLALHGWLDNAASFHSLASALPELDLVALDLAGHGHSGWRPLGAGYALVDHLQDLVAVLDQLQWPSCTLIGHSMGGAIASLLAVAAPDRVDALVCIDALGPLSLPESESPGRLLRALKARTEPAPRRRVFSSIEDATTQRARLNGLTPEQVRPLVERALRTVDEGHIWAADPRLQWPSAAPMSEAQVRACLQAIRQPTLVVAAEEADPRLPRLEVIERLACVPQAQAHRLPGGHHLHLSNTAAVAAFIREFLGGST
jgi:pimeloyl-ACP methyl ester carboxylesterase